MSTPAHLLLRRSAALLAWVGLLALPMRGLVACPMPVEVVMLEQEPSGHAEHAAHPEHAEQGPERGHHRPDAPHVPCVDVAHCAVAAVPMANSIMADVTSPMLRAASPPRAAHSAPARAVEPPPPRA